MEFSAPSYVSCRGDDLEWPPSFLSPYPVVMTVKLAVSAPHAADDAVTVNRCVREKEKKNVRFSMVAQAICNEAFPPVLASWEPTVGTVLNDRRRLSLTTLILLFVHFVSSFYVRVPASVRGHLAGNDVRTASLAALHLRRPKPPEAAASDAAVARVDSLLCLSFAACDHRYLFSPLLLLSHPPAVVTVSSPSLLAKTRRCGGDRRGRR